MTTYSMFEQLGISVRITDPLFVTNNWYSGGIRDINSFDISNMITGYRHERRTGYGDHSAQIVMLIQKEEVEEWFLRGLARNVECYNRDGVVCWSGFVNKISVKVGAHTADRGPLLDVGTRIMAAYTPRFNDVSPSSYGTSTVTTIVESADAQNLYGKIEKIINAGTCTDGEAVAARNMALEDTAYAKTTGTISLSGETGQEIEITLDCLGYTYALQMFIYTDLTSGTQTYSEKIAAVCAAEANGNGYLNEDPGLINTNAYVTSRTERDNRFGLEIIQGIATLGDINDDRWIFGVGSDRRPFYYVIPSLAEYYHSLSDKTQKIIHSGTRKQVYPWDVQCGVWVFATDLLSRDLNVPLRQDPRYKFLESVTYTAPWGIELTGSGTDKYTQKLAKMTMSGGF